MQYLNEIKNKQITVLGLGVTGLGIVRFLLSHGLAPKVVDSRATPPGIDWLKEHAPNLDTHFGNLDDAELCSSNMIIISPGLSLKIPAVANAINAGVEVIGDVELFARINTKPVVAVTGSNGKSTVVTLAYEVLKEAGYKVALGGNIGTAVLDLLNDDFDVYVLELSSFQLDTTTSLKPVSATVLNVSEDHLDRYDSYQAYIDSKLSIYGGAELIVVNADDIQTHPVERGTTPLISFGAQQGDYHLAQHNGETHFMLKGDAFLPVDTLAVVGKHNYLNTLAVMALLSPFEVSKDQYKNALGQFNGLAHRCQFVAELNGVKYFNDSKATNVGATIAAIDSLASNGENLIVIAGGDAKGADLNALKPYIEQHVKALICFGKDASDLAAITNKSYLTNNMEEAVALANVLSSTGNIVLLAPACASIDMYNNYMQRGDDFIQCVMAGQL
ncbi:UDP-N-acetylmuramoyl-L-alanine--D-glutamate ligase [Pseudoalteromonas distincta]|jgi:UDP-N-acetylmuramoylalanine--D-glutamate ligase|uniref:UDP-N-acetylmuramoyl-L-alanine--D-glutamate ligase n=1 Tax=Pseudoalteromonas TaxID=53246 RepID=UPI0011918EB4|nr:MULTISPECIES: UDP-N-acetylmuramoyl-L-alanine--D-glutamate ligase [Pseudoalteromonas]MBB1441699.1 UDP-N-acetylmuramoyl-L-alanine--D-glutamate ligase [Pseudoalteromonas sp. SG43-3]TVU72213.1 UDP-N-acetylmuramoyl-L-alanine--D-glutamate ligase [Pseudoalteromonas elyakovii]|tara:strand:- start:967 stop:2301 length:1335 start_codon:yes stop_codon:yes gene_type:complete